MGLVFDSDEDQVRYECISHLHSAWFSCESPFLWTGSGDDTYPFKVRAVEPGNDNDPLAPFPCVWR